MQEGAKIDPVAFPGTPAGWFWYSSEYVEGYTWGGVDFYTGYSGYGVRDILLYVRLVRDLQ